MIARALVVEQLEEDGTLRSFWMDATDQKRSLVVAYAGEYDEPRDGPFHFLDDDTARDYRRGFARCRARRAGSDRFRKEASTYYFTASWLGIPTERHALSYYALSLPRDAIPTRVSVWDPRRDPLSQYVRSVQRDDERRRYVVYLECSSPYGLFDFHLECEFVLSPDRFMDSSFEDPMDLGFPQNHDAYKHVLSEWQAGKVEQFFCENLHLGDQYSAHRVGAMGPGARSQDLHLEGRWEEVLGAIDKHELAGELRCIREGMRGDPSDPEQDVAAGEVAAAEIAATRGDADAVISHLQKAGRWAFRFASSVGASLVAEILARHGWP